MEKRVVLFMILSAAIMVAYVGFQATFGPKPQPKPVAKKALPKPDDPALAERPEDDPPGIPAKDPTDPDTPQVEGVPGEIASTRAQQTWVTLGSVDPDGSYRLLATLNSRGASIERIELASMRYRDLEDRSGYLGHLALATAPGGRGAKVNVVGDGTPAAKAVARQDTQLVGLRPEDVIRKFNTAPIATAREFEQALANTRPGEQVQLQVDRQGTTLDFETSLIRRPLEVIRPEVETSADPNVPTRVHAPSLRMSLVGQRNLLANTSAPDNDPLRDRPWEVEVTRNGSVQIAEFTYVLGAAEASEMDLPGPVKVVRRYKLSPVPEDEKSSPTALAYHLDCELEVENLSAAPMELAYQIDGPNGLPLEGWWYTNKIGPGWGGAGARDVVWRRTGKTRNFRSCWDVYKYAKANPTAIGESMLGVDDVTSLDYLAVDSQYFAAAWITDPAPESKGKPFRRAVSMPASDLERIIKAEYKRANATFRATSDLQVLAPHGSFQHTSRLFAGPKIPELMARYDIDDIIEYGWFRVVSIPLAHLLHFLKNNIFFNYGLAIIALTVIVRGCMVPFSLKAAKNAKMMQDLQPEMKAIAEKYKNDLQKRSEAQSALFKKYNYNPLSGCLPMFMQLPIFLGLYRALATDIELRQAPLIPGIEWASNLSGPDKLWHWEPYLPAFLAGEATGWLGPYFNILPLVSVAFLLVHQKLFTPPATDEQTKMTQDMMKYMTVFMGVLFFKVPAGLCIYFITSSLWSICERVWLPKAGPKPVTTAGEGEAKLGGFFSKPSGNGTTDKRAADKRARRPKKPKK